MINTIKNALFGGIFRDYFDDYTGGPVCYNYTSLWFKVVISLGMVKHLF